MLRYFGKPSTPLSGFLHECGRAAGARKAGRDDVQRRLLLRFRKLSLTDQHRALIFLQGKWQANEDYHDDTSKLFRALIFETNSAISANSAKLHSAPGAFVLRIAEFVFSRKTYERVFLQAVLDMREEYFDALSANRTTKARWVLIRGYVTLAMTVVLQLGVGLISKIVKAAIGLVG